MFFLSAVLLSIHSESLGRWSSFVFMNDNVKVCEARTCSAKANQHSSTHLSEDIVIYLADDEV